MAKWLAKANDLVISHCTCEQSVAATPVQLDCPWCGCGWLMSCAHCRKAFTYAQVVQVDQNYVDLARSGIVGEEVSQSELEDIAGWMERSVKPFQYGDVVVYLDGAYHRLDEQDLSFEGWFAEHNFVKLPHADASTKADIDDVLGLPAYWLDRELPDRNDQ